MNPSNKSSTPEGWNDPPADLALSDNMSTKRVLLNKRVPYTNQDLSSTNNRMKTLPSSIVRCICVFYFSVECFNSTTNVFAICST